MSLNQWPGLALKVGVTLWMVVASAWDMRHHRLPNALVLPVMLGAMLWQLYRLIAYADTSILFALIAWVVVFLLWQGHILGGGDAKVLMALFAMFPTVSFLILFSLVKVGVTVPLLVARYWGRRPADLWHDLRQRTREGRWLPDQQELRIKGQSNCWTYCLPGAVYLWWLM